MACSRKAGGETPAVAFDKVLESMSSSDIDVEEAIESTEHPWRDEEVLRELYIERKMPMSYIGERVGCSGDTIRRWLNRHNIDTRSLSEVNRLKKPAKPQFRTRRKDGYVEFRVYHRGEPDRVLIHRLVAVAEFGFDAVSGKVVHHVNEIPWDNRPGNLETMTRSEHSILHRQREWGGKLYRDEAWLREMYIEREMTTYELADMADCGRTAISRWLRRYDIQTRGPHGRRLKDP